MNTKYIKPSMEILNICTDDIIAASLLNGNGELNWEDVESTEWKNGEGWK